MENERLYYIDGCDEHGWFVNAGAPEWRTVSMRLDRADAVSLVERLNHERALRLQASHLFETPEPAV